MRSNLTTLVVRFLLAVLLCTTIGDFANAVMITPGNLVVTRTLGTTNAATAVVIDEYLTGVASQGSPVQTIALPTANGGSGTIPNAVTLSASGVEGMITLSTNGQYVTVAGYAANVGTATPQSSTSASVPRSIARMDITSANPGSTIDSTTAMNNAFDGSNVRSAVTTNGTDIWAGGGGTNGGAVYTTLGSTTGTRVNTGTGTGSTRRVVNIYNGQLYISGASTGGPNLSVNAVGPPPLPTAAGANETTLPGLPTTGTHSPYDFWFKDDRTLYLTDDSNTAASGGGIQKWTLSAGTWSLQYTLLNNGATTTGTRGLAGTTDSNGDAVLFATVNANSPNSLLIQITDLGSQAASQASLITLATAAAGNLFKGVEFIPTAINVPEVSSFLLVGMIGTIVYGFNGLRRRDG